jgi:hypothetical protein
MTVLWIRRILVGSGDDAEFAAGD